MYRIYTPAPVQGCGSQHPFRTAAAYLLYKFTLYRHARTTQAAHASKWENVGRYSRFWASISLTICRISASDKTAAVSGSWAIAW
jgi:hypothetical protein